MPNTAPRNWREKVSKQDRLQVQRTYGNQCHLCSYQITDFSHFTADHVKSVRAGGSTVLSNLRPAHKTCNEFRSSRPLTPIVKAECRHRYERLVLAR